MKYISLLLVIVFFSCKERATSQKQIANKNSFHIKAKYSSSCYWRVSFTNNNFDTDEEMLETYDISELTGGYMGVRLEPMLFSKDEAIEFAKRFHNYAACRKWQDSIGVVYSGLKKFRNAHPIVYSTNAASCKKEDKVDVVVH